MIKLWFFALFGIAVATPIPQSTEILIVGGHDINITEAPYQVAVLKRGDISCGGTIVAKYIIITAAHCVAHAHNKANDFQIRAGSSYTTTGGELYPVRKLLWHPGFTFSTVDYDIAVMLLSKPLEFSDKVAAIDMIDEHEEIADGEETIVTGWGITSENGPDPAIVLQMVMVPKVNEKVCRDAYKHTHTHILSSRMICAGLRTGGNGFCNGDSGGPMVYNKKLAGVVSWSVGCARPGYPGVFAKVSALRTWIDEKIKDLKFE